MPPEHLGGPPTNDLRLDLSCCLRTTLMKEPADGAGTIREAMSTIESLMAGTDLTMGALQAAHRRFWFEEGWKWYTTAQEEALSAPGNAICALLRSDLRAGMDRVLSIRPDVSLASIIARFSNRDRAMVWSGAVSEFFDREVRDTDDYLAVIETCEEYRQACPYIVSNADLGAALYQLNRTLRSRGPCIRGADCPNAQIVGEAVQELLQSERMTPLIGGEILPTPLKRRFAEEFREYLAGVAALACVEERMGENFGYRAVSFPRVRAFAQVVQAIQHPTLSVLLLGPTGTGKEVLARAAHAFCDRRRGGPFVAQNCASGPETLVESELFGHEANAFTGAGKASKGKFRTADRGTLFLDEIGEMPPTTQAKLLRVLTTREVEPVGGDSKAYKVDVRVVSATNRDLIRAINREEFRADLYSRINGKVVHVPRLRRGDLDVPGLAVFFLERERRSQGKDFQFAGDAIPTLRTMEWPHNIRDLENLMMKATTEARRGLIDGSALRRSYRGTIEQQAGTSESRTFIVPPENRTVVVPPAPAESKLSLIPSRANIRQFLKSNPEGLGKTGYFAATQEAFKIAVVQALAREGDTRVPIGRIAKLLGLSATPLTALLKRHRLLDRDGKANYIKDSPEQ